MAVAGRRRRAGATLSSRHNTVAHRATEEDPARHAHLVHTLNHDVGGGDGSDDDDGGDVDHSRDEWWHQHRSREEEE